MLNVVMEGMSQLHEDTNWAFKTSDQIDFFDKSSYLKFEEEKNIFKSCKCPEYSSSKAHTLKSQINYLHELLQTSTSANDGKIKNIISLIAKSLPKEPMLMHLEKNNEWLVLLITDELGSISGELDSSLKFGLGSFAISVKSILASFSICKAKQSTELLIKMSSLFVCFCFVFSIYYYLRFMSYD